MTRPAETGRTDAARGIGASKRTFLAGTASLVTGGGLPEAAFHRARRCAAGRTHSRAAELSGLPAHPQYRAAAGCDQRAGDDGRCLLRTSVVCVTGTDEHDGERDSRTRTN
jgi:hypothetical protein